MAQVTGAPHDGARVLDCACGSGRLLMAAAKLNRNALFFGADIDRTCCLMSVINFCLNGMLGEVAWMDSLSNKFYGAWRIELHPEHYVPYIREITDDESYIVLRLPEAKAEIQPPKQLPVVGAQQQLLFEF